MLIHKAQLDREDAEEERALAKQDAKAERALGKQEEQKKGGRTEESANG